MVRLWIGLILASFTSSLTIAQPVLIESALLIQAPMHQGIWPAWFDGDQFWVQPESLMNLLGYEILFSDSTELVVRDMHHAITFRYAKNEIHVNGNQRHRGSFSMIDSNGDILITMEALQHAFGSDMVWDIEALTLRLSSAATLFDPTWLTQPEELPVLFPHERNWLGGLHIGYTLSHQWHQRTGRTFTPSGRLAAHVVGGTVRWAVSRHTSRVHYTLDFDHQWLSRIQVGQIGNRLGLQISNRPLESRHIHREEMIDGITIPHSIVRGKVSGTVQQEVQADQDGRYALRYPVYYGSTETEIEVQPLGASPMEMSKTYWLTPSEILPSRHLEYDVTLTENPYGKISWGLSSKITLQTVVSRVPETAMMRALMLIRPTMYLDLRADVLDQGTHGDFHWWRPWGGVSITTQIQEGILNTSGSISLNRDRASLHTRVSHHRTNSQPAQTRFHSIAGWQVFSNLSVYSGVRMQSGESIALRPRFNYVLPHVRPRIHLQASAIIKDQEVKSYEGGVLASSRNWSSGVRVASREDGFEVRANLQINTDWAWLNSQGGWADREFFHRQTLRGTIMIGEDIRFAALYEERTQAVIRLFRDTNLNGVLDDRESLLLRHQLSMGGHLILHRTDGEVIAPNLIAYQRYPVKILEESIVDPLLHPATGYAFAFVALPGRTRYIDIALQPLPTVFGQLTDWDGAYTVLQVHFTGTEDMHELDVYHDGAFFAQLRPGDYRVTIVNLLTNEIIKKTDVTVVSGTNSVTISTH